MYHLPYNKDLKTFARQLRNNSTLGEILLWQKLRAGNIKGYAFNRQKPIDNYIVDFYCKPLNLVIEVDGGYHYKEKQVVKDKERQEVIQKQELNFLRFHDDEVRKDIDIVLRKIEDYITAFEEQKNQPSAKYPLITPIIIARCFTPPFQRGKASCYYNRTSIKGICQA